MTVVKTSGFVDGMKGKVSGDIFQYNQGGLVCRSGKTSCRTALSSYNRQTSILGTMSAMWRTLSDTQRGYWAGWGTVDLVYTRFGVLRRASGYNEFCKCNGRLIALNFPPYPGTLTWPGYPPTQHFSIGNPYHGALQIVWGFFTTGYDQIVIAMTPTMSAGRKPPIGYFRILAVLDAFDFTDIDMYSFYVPAWGQPVIGQRANFQCWVINTLNGLISPKTVLTAIVT